MRLVMAQNFATDVKDRSLLHNISLQMLSGGRRNLWRSQILFHWGDDNFTRPCHSIPFIITGGRIQSIKDLITDSYGPNVMHAIDSESLKKRTKERTLSMGRFTAHAFNVWRRSFRWWKCRSHDENVLGFTSTSHFPSRFKEIWGV